MLSTRIISITNRAIAARALHGTVRVAAGTAAGKDPALSQGTERSGAPPSAHHPLDAASGHGGKHAKHDGTGNPKGVGFVEQVGGASASDPQKDGGRKGGKEDTTPPGFFSAVKEKLGLGTTSDQAKQNRGGGVGVMGAGTKRTYHGSAATWDAPKKSRRPKEPVMGEQNAHLKHKSDTSRPDSGKGNAGENPRLPSQQEEYERQKPQFPSQQIMDKKNWDKRAFHTSARSSVDQKGHTAESYFKEVDENAPTGKTHQVDPSATGAPVTHANDPIAPGKYDTMSQEQPYDTELSEGPEKDQKNRYGNIPGLGAKEQQNGGGDRVSPAESGPEGGTAGGHKPEGRS